jgi:hypothetical protein
MSHCLDRRIVMEKEFLGKGWKFPIGLSKRRQIALSEEEEAIKESIQIILGTSKGERLMRPEFGCNLQDMVFAPMDASTKKSIALAVEEALMLFEPRIDLIRVEVTTEPEAEGRLLIEINYRIRETNALGNLVYPFYIKGE